MLDMLNKFPYNNHGIARITPFESMEGMQMRHSKLWTSALVAVTVLALLAPVAMSALAATYPYETISMDDVNLRSRANTSSVVLKRIKAGDTVTILGVSGDFYRVSFDGSTGYAMKRYIDGTDPAADPTPNPDLVLPPITAISEYPYDTITIDRVKLRKKAETEGEVIRTLLADTVVTVQELTDNGFAKVRVDGDTGYVLASHLNLADIPAPTPTPSPTPVPGTEKYTELKKGDEGDAVTALQSALAELDYLEEDEVDGKFGAATESALMTFQRRNGLERDGIADVELQLLLYEGTPKDYRGYRQYVKTLPPVAGVNIREDATGKPVSNLQTRLQELGYYSGPINGVFDEDTVAAWLMFEGKHGLVADGEASAEDQAILYGATALTAGSVSMITPTPTVPRTPPTQTLRRGDEGEEVRTLQLRLTELGYFTATVNGNFNNATEEALKAFQIKNGLEDDGVCGPITVRALFDLNAIYAVPTPIPVTTPSPTEEPLTEENVVVIRAGTLGSVVLRLQTRLEELDYYESRKDGVYLSDDIQAVRDFQKANGLTVDGVAGFETQSLLYSDVAVRGNYSQSLEILTTLRYGSEGEEVSILQNRLIALGYLAGSADGIFGRNTKTAVQAFQKASGLDADGVVGEMTQAALDSSNAVANTVSTSTTLRIGTVSDAVRDLQSRLIALGFLNGAADGNFGVKTSAALMEFQRANGLTVDGVAGYKTLTALNSTNVIGAQGEETTTTAPTVTTSNINASMVRYANWYTEVRQKCRTYPNVTVYDFTTGISWHLNIFSNGAHADAEPITAEDTANMNRAFGGVTTWTPKAVWVMFSDGTVYIATTHNTPHDVNHNQNNNFDGHVCIHFPRTQEQVESIGPYATQHQKAVELGWEATLKRATLGVN